MNKIIRVSVTEDEVSKIDELSNGVLFRLAKEAYTVHTQNLMDIEDDFDYYFGLKPFNKLSVYSSWSVFNGDKVDVETVSKQNIAYAKYICDTSRSITVGRSPTFALRDPLEKEKKSLTNINNMYAYRDFNKSLSDTIQASCTCGVGYRLIHNKDGDQFPRFSKLDSKQTFVVYDNSVEPESVLGVFYSPLDEKNFYVYVYTNNFMHYFNSKSPASLSVADLVKSVPHSFGRVPITEYANNEYRMGDATAAYAALELICMGQNDVVMGNHDKVKTLLVLKNVVVGSEARQKIANDLFKSSRMLSINGEGDSVDAKYITPQVDDSSANENLSKIDNEVWMASRIVNFNDPDFAQNASEPALKLKMKGMIDLIKEKEKYITPCLKREIKMTLAYLKSVGSISKYDLDITKLNVVYNHPLPSNDQEKATILQTLYNMDMFNPELLRELSFMDDDLSTYLTGIVKKPIAQKEKEAKGVNPNNIKREQEAKTVVGGGDNAMNKAKGVATDIENQWLI